jgi:hypothetical protein
VCVLLLLLFGFHLRFGIIVIRYMISSSSSPAFRCEVDAGDVGGDGNVELVIGREGSDRQVRVCV